MREVKNPEERKEDILTMSERLFFEKGYIPTTTNDIIKALGISRGLLYYHFESKEDILWHIVENRTRGLISKFDNIVNNSVMTAPEKVRAFIEATITVDPENNDLTKKQIEQLKSLQDTIQLKENNYMLDQISHKISYKATGVFERIILQGVKEGNFKVDYPYATASFLMTGLTFVLNDPHYHGNTIEGQMLLFNGFKELIYKTLGLKPFYY
ncbi:MAG: TetR/AcrR family transcriptional regulator [Spirochaetaceae bacterium]